ncbi:MAG TPA: protoglobin domain-containing protein, partial [Candidatus Tectomicrobia bacterium]|nr:protoglobin domain-containing protein [Candidatus Tectomicrobia bacterium]
MSAAGDWPYLPATDMPRFLRDMAAFVELDEADVALIRRTAPAVLAREEELTGAVYEHFLRFPFSARFFLGPDGEPDEARLARRRHSLARWLRGAVEAAMTPEPAYALLTIGLAHSHRPSGTVPSHLMVGAMSLLQTALARILGEALDDPRAALDASVAWNKWLLVQLAALQL